MKTLQCATLEGFDAKVVEVEAAFVRALPSFAIVGLAQASIQESKERIKSALSAIDFTFPPLKITINLSPSDLRKEGSHFDLPIALNIALQKADVDFKSFFAFGELGLDGRLKDTNSIFPIILSLARTQQLDKVIIPQESLEKVSKIPGINIFPVETLKEAIVLFSKESQTTPFSTKDQLDDAYITCHDQKYYYSTNYSLDFSDIRGQEIAKRAALISVTGMHNILFEGSPGCGKSMCIKRMKEILPPMSLKEILERAKLDAINADTPDFKPVRNFRSPHHTSTRASIFGGGSREARVGEVALANNGILFFDEFPHFPKSILESLREPLEDYRLLISRVNSKTEYRTKFLFAAAMNPCPCGNLFSSINECRCSDYEIQRYKNKLSAPLLDRIDIYVQMDEVQPDDQPTISSKEMFASVKKAFQAQICREQNELNGKMSDEEITKYCILCESGNQILHNAAMKFGLSQRGIKKTLKVARTIADLDESESIEKKHLMEALRYRMRT